jgi:DNA-binding MarR family transcriptional regulator
MDSGELLLKAYRLINLYNATQKKPRTYSGGLVLYPAQTHMLEIIGDSEGISQSMIASEYMITKGAVSQIISFLDKKELIEKKPSKEGGRSVGLYLSERGREIFAEHRELHSYMIAEVTRLAEKLPSEATEILLQIADVIEESIRKIQP